MPLDTGAFSELDRGAATSSALARIRASRPALDPEGHVGAALRDLRLRFDLSLDQVAEATKIRPAHISALEAFDFDHLPARPFTIGYLRAYAEVLGLDAGDVVARFKLEAPRIDTDLHAPAGVAHQRSRRGGWIAAAAAMAAIAILGWNFSRHAWAAPRPVNRSQGASQEPAAPQAGPAHLGAPLPAPPEAATPAVYETPGLAAAVAAGGSAVAAPTPAAAAQPVAGALSGPTGARFIAAGAVYGDQSSGSGLILQARTPTALVVRGSAGTVYFARELASGEAWRAPAQSGLTVDVGEPQAVEVFQGGVSKGLLTHPQTPLDKLGA